MKAGKGGRGGEGDGLFSNDDGRRGKDGRSLLTVVRQFDLLIERFRSFEQHIKRGKITEWYVAAYPDIQYLPSDYRLIDPANPNSTAELFVEAGPDAYGEVDYVLHPQYIASVSRIRIQIEGRVDGDNPLLELDLQNWDGTILRHVTLANGVPVPGKPGWVRLAIDAVRSIPMLPFGPDFDTFVVRFRDVEMDNLTVRGIVPRADVNANGAVGAEDAQEVLQNTGTPMPEPTEGDVNGDTVIDGVDLNEVIQGIGGESDGD